MKILITGGTGYIGRHLAAFWQHSVHQVMVLARQVDPLLFDRSVLCLEADITAEDTLRQIMLHHWPDVVIHCAATSKPNDCEVNQEQAYRINVTATGYLAAACQAIGAKLVFLSTDFVFGHHGPYREADRYDPVNYYGITKQLAEEQVKAAGIPYAIVRTVLVVGAQLPGGPPTFLHWAKAALEAGQPVWLYTDQQRSVTYVQDICQAIQTILESRFEGTVHISGEGVFTPYQLAGAVARHLGYDPGLLHPVDRHQRPEAAVRPENSVLIIDKARAVLGYTPTPLAAVLQQVFG